MIRFPFALALLLGAAPLQAAPLQVVAAENMYADLVRQIGGAGVSVTAILDNPSQDPHLFEASPSVARGLSAAGLVVYNGADYDPWMRGLLTATAGPPRRVIDVADLMHVGAGANPHLWYDPKTMPVLAVVIARALAAADPSRAEFYSHNLAIFQAALAPVAARIADLRGRYKGQAITATEPVFGLMAAALGLIDRNPDFQRAVMNGTEPSAAEIAGMEGDLRGHAVRLLIRNSQASDAASDRLVRIAQAAGVPVIAVSETEPAGLRYQAWMLRTLDAIDQALRQGMK